MVEDVVGFDIAVNESLLFFSELGILFVIPLLGQCIKERLLFLLGLLAESGEFFVQDIDVRTICGREGLLIIAKSRVSGVLSVYVCIFQTCKS